MAVERTSWPRVRSVRPRAREAGWVRRAGYGFDGGDGGCGCVGVRVKDDDDDDEDHGKKGAKCRKHSKKAAA